MRQKPRNKPPMNFPRSSANGCRCSPGILYSNAALALALLALSARARRRIESTSVPGLPKRISDILVASQNLDEFVLFDRLVLVLRLVVLLKEGAVFAFRSDPVQRAKVQQNGVEKSRPGATWSTLTPVPCPSWPGDTTSITQSLVRQVDALGLENRLRLLESHSVLGQA